MGMLDRLKDKAGEMVQGAVDRVSEATGVDAEKVLDAADSLDDAREKVSDAVDSLREGKLPD
jgi:hypothetical protein